MTVESPEVWANMQNIQDDYRLVMVGYKKMAVAGEK